MKINTHRIRNCFKKRLSELIKIYKKPPTTKNEIKSDFNFEKKDRPKLFLDVIKDTQVILNGYLNSKISDNWKTPSKDLKRKVVTDFFNQDNKKIKLTITFSENNLKKI